MSIRCVQLTYRVGALGDLRVSVYTDLEPDDPLYDTRIDELAQQVIQQELVDYGEVGSYD